MNIALFLGCLFSFGVRAAEPLDCYVCSGLRSVSDCHNVDLCPSGQVCYSERTVAGSGISYSMGCRPPQQCPSSSVVGRSVSKRAVCSECCNTDACNKRICEAPATTTVATTPYSGVCEDAAANCAGVKEFVCPDPILNTKCAKTCGLCLAAASPSPTSLSTSSLPLLGVCVDEVVNCSSPILQTMICQSNVNARMYCRKSCNMCDQPAITPIYSSCGDLVSADNVCPSLQAELCVCADPELRMMCAHYCAGECAHKPTLTCHAVMSYLY
ncbi:keratin-associated protein 16-1-like isoform X2 [Dreissena polymorpha]|uniref:keratin-associated protein 16-1-like isoform X2 n=1 Tax=Dreissena polymorpha TaxID=45954 RepID=UPI00226444A2|nr:keratin-associated protein 16-1-like isoform X2 [Dreissena polymorpha]